MKLSLALRQSPRTMDTNFVAFSILITIIICLTHVSCQRQNCLGSSNYCPGQFGDMKAICKDGFCFCTGQDYNYSTCLPDAYGCQIEVNADTAFANPLYNNQPQITYSCKPGNSSTQYEIHVLSVYEANRVHTRPPIGSDAAVNIVRRGRSNRPFILVLGSYEPVNWILKLPANITISKVILIGYYVDESSVSGDTNQVQVVERRGIRTSLWSYGYGTDSGGGDTVGLLNQVFKKYGVVTSFTGTYRADDWTLVLSLSHGSGFGNFSSSAAPIPTSAPALAPKLHRQKYNTFLNSSQDNDYNFNCTTDAYGCKIVLNADTALGKPQNNNQQPQTIYSCTPGSSSTQYEIHVLSVYEGSSHTRPPTAGDTPVNIVGNSNRPIILVLGSYEPVNWILNLPAGITISKVILVAYYIDESSVSGDVNQVQAVERKGMISSQWSYGYGTDSGGGNTVGLLKQIHSRFGVVTSFTGTYKAYEWSLVLPSAHGSGPGIIGSSVAASITATATVVYTPTPNTPTIHRQKCYSNYCSGGYKMNAVCRDGYCVCTGQGYNYETCLPDAYGCKIVLDADTALAKPQYKSQRRNTYSCTPGSSSPQYEVHVLSVYEVINRRPPEAGDATVNIISQRRSDRPIILVLGSYEPVHWILNLQAGVTISKVILVAYYLEESSVSGVGVQAVERKNYQWGVGFGSDSGGGDTVALLKQVYNRFGVVTSFTGTYKADEWSLVLSSPKPPRSPPCQNYKCLSKAIQKLSKMVKKLREDVETQDERITALELEKNQGNQYRAIAQYSSGVSAYKSLETILGIFIITIMGGAVA
ncbi:hypothetical protein ACROYT_G032337 [Oculina patagonica]